MMVLYTPRSHEAAGLERCGSNPVRGALSANGAGKHKDGVVAGRYPDLQKVRRRPHVTDATQAFERSTAANPLPQDPL